MARYIDSEPVEKFYQDTLDDISGMKEYEEFTEYCKKALNNLKEQPTVDAIPREKINRMIEEITKYAQAMDWISGYDVLLLIHKYCDEVQ